ncbi:PROZ protein, partial [Nothoprocta ornata]|nr:PROZ protein [Nothoprocta ornata]
ILSCNTSVFISGDDANKVIKRHRRANSLLLEEVLQGSLERECLEERCTHEEAREVFENDDMLKMFWDAYYEGRRCSSNPCQHNGVCEDNIRSYTCTCVDGYEGENCAFAKNECRHDAKEGCHHFCYPGTTSYHCSCADGYKLGKDKKQCIALDECACGTVQDTNSVTSETRRKWDKGFPWQVLLLNSEGKGFCGGVLLRRNFVLTTAECALLHSDFEIRVGAGHNGTEGPESSARVSAIHVHMRYDADTGDNDVALLRLRAPVECSTHQRPVCVPERDFAEHVLIPHVVGTVSGWKRAGGGGEELRVSYVPVEECQRALNGSLTTRQFCGRRREAAAGRLAGGGFVAAEYKGTWFLTGILGSRPPGNGDSETFVFTNTARYAVWFKQKMK